MEDWKSTFQEDSRAIRARQQLKKERARLLLKKWDGIVKTLLHRIAVQTWREEMRRVTFRRTVGQQHGSFGLHWEACIEESGRHTRYYYIHKAYFRVTLVTDDNFVPGHFVVERRDRRGRKNRRIVVSVSIEGIKAALLEAYRSGPAVYSYVMEE